MTNDPFWAHIDEQIAKLESAETVDAVLAICPHIPGSSCSPGCTDPGHGFFEGSGGDKQVRGALYAAGWTEVWARASYYWCMKPADGPDYLEYVEGDLYRRTVPFHPKEQS